MVLKLLLLIILNMPLLLMDGRLWAMYAVYLQMILHYFNQRYSIRIFYSIILSVFYHITGDYHHHYHHLHRHHVC